MNDLINRADLVYDKIYEKISQPIFNKVLSPVWTQIRQSSQNTPVVPSDIYKPVNLIDRIKSEIQTLT